MLTHDQVRKALNYCPDTGEFTWCGRHGCRGDGGRAGRVTDRGYINIAIDGRAYRAHRLAWLYQFGVWPSAEIDHINGQRSDNRIANLREATRTQNSANQRARGSIASFKGVHIKSGNLQKKFEARIWTGEKYKTLGTFSTPEEANAAYYEAAKKLHGEFARAG